MFSKITASHYVLPSQSLTNEDLFKRFDPKKIKGISKLSGIYERRIAPKDVTSVDLGTESARRMIESCNIDKNSIDMLIFVSPTRDYILPQSAAIIHNKLSLSEHCGTFDIVMGCPALPYSLGVANGLIASGQCSKILLIIADTITKLVNPKDRGLVPLHGDGAASFIIEKSSSDDGIEFVETFTDSKNWDVLIVPAGGCRRPYDESTQIESVDESGNIVSPENLQMNGAAVFHFSISKIPETIKNCLEKHNFSLDRYKLVLLHQANKMMLDNIYNSIKATQEQRFFFMENVGNLSAASTPVLLAEAMRTKKISKGDNVLLSSFGVGLSWGVCSVKFGNFIASTADVEY